MRPPAPRCGRGPPRRPWPRRAATARRPGRRPGRRSASGRRTAPPPPAGAGPTSRRLGGPGRPGQDRLARAGSGPGRRPGPRPRRSACAGSFCRHFRQIVSRSRGTRRLQPPRRHRLLRPHLVERVERRRRLERRPAGQQLVEDRPEARRRRPPGRPPRRRPRPARGPCSWACRGPGPVRVSAALVEPLGQAEVGDLRRRPSAVEQDVGRLQVAVDDPAAVRLGDGARQRARPAAAASAAGLGVAVERVGEAAAVAGIPARSRGPRPPRRPRRSGRCSGAGAGRPPRPRRGSARGSAVGAAVAGQDHLEGDQSVQADAGGPGRRRPCRRGPVRRAPRTRPPGGLAPGRDQARRQAGPSPARTRGNHRRSAAHPGKRPCFCASDEPWRRSLMLGFSGNSSRQDLI